MAQSITSVDNPNFKMAPLSTIANTIVQRRKIKIPMTNPTTISGVRGGRSAQQSYMYFDMADNECFVNLNNLVFVTELTFTGWGELPIPIAFDPSIQSIIASFSIGTSQGLKIEEHSNYSLYASLIETITETPDEKEWSQQHYSVWDKQSAVYRGQNMFTDNTRGVNDDRCIYPGRRYRIHMQICHASLPSKAPFLPLFIFRNGIRFQFNFESVYKAFVADVGLTLSQGIELPMVNFYEGLVGHVSDIQSGGTATGFSNTLSITDLGFPWRVDRANWFILHGTNELNDTVTAPNPALADGGGAVTATNNYRPPVAPASAPPISSYATLWITNTHGWLGRIPRAGVNQMVYIPVKFYRQSSDQGASFKTLVWSGLAAREHPKYSDAADPFDDSEIYGSTGRVAYNVGATPLGMMMWATPGGSVTFAKNPNIAAVNSKPFIGFHLYGDYENNIAPFQFTNIDTLSLNMVRGQYSMELFPQDCFTGGFSLAGSIKPTPLMKSTLHPTAGLWYRSIMPNSTPDWSYVLDKSELIMDLVKPAADDFAKVQAAFTSPSGIPWALDRVLYRKNTINVSGGVVQVGVNISVRSLRNILICFQDPTFDLETSKSSRYFTNHLSSFLRSGLSQAEVVVGGQVYPIYPMLLRGQLQGTDVQNPAHLIELKSMMGNVSKKGMNTAMTLDSQKSDARLYSSWGSFDITEAQLLALTEANDHGSYIVDASKFILGFSLKKDDIMSFVTGIDTSQSGAVHINLHFNDTSANRKWPEDRRLDCHTYFVCDEIFTAQNDGNLVRY